MSKTRERKKSRPRNSWYDMVVAAEREFYAKTGKNGKPRERQGDWLRGGKTNDNIGKDGET